MLPLKLPCTKFYCAICKGTFVKRDVKKKSHITQCLAKEIKKRRKWERVKKTLHKKRRKLETSISHSPDT